MDREAILSLGKAYNECYTLTEQEQAEVDAVYQYLEENPLNLAIGTGLTFWDYDRLRKQGYTHPEAIAKAILMGGASTVGGLLGAKGGLALGGPLGLVAGGLGGGVAGEEGAKLLYDKLTGRVKGTVKDKDGNDVTVSKVPGQTATLNGKKVVWGKEGGWQPVGGGAATEPAEEPTTQQEPTTTEVKPDPEKLDALNQGKDKTPVATAAQMYKDQAKEKEQQQQPQTQPQTQPEDQGGQKLTPMQQWAKNFPKLAAKVKPGQAGYDEIQKMGKGSQAGSAGGVAAAKTQVKNMVKNTQKLNQGSKNMKTDIKTPVVRAASKIGDASKNFSDKMKKVTDPTKKAFATIPEEITWEEELLIYMIENDIDEVYGRDLYLDEGFGKLLRKLGSKSMPAVKAGWKRVKEGGKWVLKKVRSKDTRKTAEKVKDAADEVADAVKTKTRKAKGGLLDKDGKPLKVKETKPVKKPGKVKSKDRVDAPKPDAPKVKKPGGSGRVGGAVKNTAKAAVIAGAGYAGYRGLKHLADKQGGGGGSSSDPKETTSKPETTGTKPGGGGGGAGGGSTPKPGGSSGTPKVKVPTRKPGGGRSSWRKPVGRREHIQANNRRIREDFDLDSVLDAMCEGLPEPKVNYLKDMDPYDPRRRLQQHAPGSPLPPPSMRPGIPEFFRKAKKDDKKKKDTKKA